LKAGAGNNGAEKVAHGIITHPGGEGGDEGEGAEEIHVVFGFGGAETPV